MLLSEIVYNIKNLISGGIQSDDEDLSDDQVAFIVNYYRAKLLRQDISKGRPRSEVNVQNLGKVSLIQADKNECCEVDACILRTKFKVPKPLAVAEHLNLSFVGTLDGIDFTKKSHNTMRWACAAKYTGNETMWYYQNGYIYITNPSTQLLKYINVQGVFENPVDAEKFRTCDCDNGLNCSNGLDVEYPMSITNVDLIVKMIAETELNILMSLPSDLSNDGIDQAQA